MNGQIVLVGYDDKANDKILIVEGTCEGEGEDEIDVVRFPNLNVSIDRPLLLNAIEFLKNH